MTNIDKNMKIKQSITETRNRRKSQICRVYTVKIDESSLSKKQKEHLKMLFVEAKWVANDIINYSKQGNSIFEYKLSNIVTHKDKDMNDIISELKYLGSQMKQSLYEELKSNIKGLSHSKKNGNKVGQIKFKSEVKSLNLKQYNNTYKILSDKKMKIQGVKNPIRVNGLNQFINIKNIEYANAKILNLPTGYYIAITTFIYKDDIKENKIDDIIGLDFGISSNLTTSKGDKYNMMMQESDRLKRLQTKLNRQNKGSKRRYKTISLIKKEYQKISNRKNDYVNKLVHDICKYKIVVMQDEQISKWKNDVFSDKIHHSILGRLKAKLINKDNVIVLNKYLPTTKLCTKCNTKNDKIKLSDRIFICPNCGYTEDRDIHAAKNMIDIYKILVGMGHTDFKRIKELPKCEDTTL